MKSSFLHLTAWFSIFAAALVAYGFWYSVIVNKSLAVADLQQQIDAKTNTANIIASARLALTEIAGDESVVQSYFVSEAGVVPFINDMEARARAQTASTKVLSVSMGGTAKRPTLSISLTIDGTFDAVMRSIGAIEYAPYDLSITKLSLDKNAKDTWHAGLELVVGSVPKVATTSKP